MVVTPEKVRTGWSHRETVPQLLYEECAFPDRSSRSTAGTSTSDHAVTLGTAASAGRAVLSAAVRLHSGSRGGSLPPRLCELAAAIRCRRLTRAARSGCLPACNDRGRYRPVSTTIRRAPGPRRRRVPLLGWSASRAPRHRHLLSSSSANCW